MVDKRLLLVFLNQVPRINVLQSIMEFLAAVDGVVAANQFQSTRQEEDQANEEIVFFSLSLSDVIPGLRRC